MSVRGAFALSLGLVFARISGAQTIGRRGFLASGAFSAVAKLFRSAAPPVDVAAPIAENPLSPAMARFRGDLLAQATHISEGYGSFWTPIEPHRSRLSPVQLEIIEDWCRHHPGQRGEVDRLTTLIGDSDLRYAMTSEAREELTQREQRVRALVSDYPWSTFSWGQVFGQRIAQAEKRLALALGVDEALIWQLTEHITDQTPYSSSFSLIRALQASDYGRFATPLYSSAMIERLAVAVEEVSSAYAAQIRLIDSAESQLTEEHLRRALLPKDAQYLPHLNAPMKFWFAAAPFETTVYTRDAASIYRPEVMEAHYLKAYEHLRLLQERLDTLGDSTLVTRARGTTDFLIRELLAEFTTLPRRLRAFVNQRELSGYDRDWDGTTWDSLNHPEPDPRAAWAWAKRVEALSVTYQVLAPIALELVARAASPTASCETLVVEAAEAPRLTHELSASLPLEVESPDLMRTNSGREQ